MSKDSPPPEGWGSPSDASRGDVAPESGRGGAPYPSAPGPRSDSDDAPIGHPFSHLPRVLLPLQDDEPGVAGTATALPWAFEGIERRRRRWPRVAVAGALLVGLVGAGVALGLTLEDGPLEGSLESGGSIPPDPTGTPVVATPGDATRGGAGAAAETAGAGDLSGATIRPLGNAQRAEVGGVLGDSIGVRILDGEGRPMQGVPIAFRAAEESGSVSPSDPRTDDTGLARAAWALGAAEGEQHVTASVGDGGRTVTFRAFAAPRPPAVAEASRADDAAPDAPARAQRDAGGGDADASPAAVLTVLPGIVPGGTFSCRLDESGSLSCWGDDASGQLGRQLDRDATFAVVSPGVRHACALTREGEAYCWGSNGNGQLGTTRTGVAQDGREVDAPVALRAISTGLAHNCALGIDSRAYCWGGNDHGQLGTGDADPRSAPTAVATRLRFGLLRAGWLHTCALTLEGSPYCWGRNKYGQLGNGSTRSSARPTAVAGDVTFTDLAAGSDHVCGLSAAGVAYCWGRNNAGQLGVGDTEDRTTPTPVAGAVRFRSIASGGVHACGLTEDGLAYCWGSNAYGQLGDGTTTDRPVPTPVSRDLRFRRLLAAGAHTCGEATDGDEYCWGYNRHGQLGDRSRNNRAEPTRVSAR